MSVIGDLGLTLGPLYLSFSSWIFPKGRVSLKALPSLILLEDVDLFEQKCAAAIREKVTS
jgi:hypothetical protein